MNKMRPITLLGGIVMVTILCAQVGGGAATNGVAQKSQDSKKWIDAWVEMWNSYDLNQVDKLFLRDNRLSYFSSGKEGAIRGIKAVREHRNEKGKVQVILLFFLILDRLLPHCVL
jgi:hypothetical protein